MKAIAPNLYQHENGKYYALWTAKEAPKPGETKGKSRPQKKSLKTKNLHEAKQRLKNLLGPGWAPYPPQPSLSATMGSATPVANVLSLPMLALMPQTTVVYSLPAALGVAEATPVFAASSVSPVQVPITEQTPVPSSELALTETPAQARPPFLEAVKNHLENTAFSSDDTERNFILRQETMLKYCTDWPKFEPVAIWKQFDKLGYISAPNQLRWYLRSFVDYCCEKKWLEESYLKTVEKIPLKTVPPRRVKIPPSETTSQLLAMCEAEDKECGAFIRYISVTGQRITAGNGLRWEEIDFAAKQFWRKVKGGKTEYFPMIPEAIDLLRKRHEDAGKPLRGPVWGFSDRKRKKAVRILKKYAKGLEIELSYFHALRHHFASVALDQGMSPADVAKLLGHKDGGILVLKVYGHIIEKRMAEKVAALKIAG